MTAIVGILFFLSDLLSPIWIYLLSKYLYKIREWKMWQSWLIASSLGIVQSYLVGKYIGWNLSSQLFIVLVTTLFDIKKITQFDMMTIVYTISLLIFVIAPTSILYIVEKIYIKPKFQQ